MSCSYHNPPSKYCADCLKQPKQKKPSVKRTLYEQLRKQGLSYAQIAKNFGVSKQAVHQSLTYNL